MKSEIKTNKELTVNINRVNQDMITMRNQLAMAIHELGELQDKVEPITDKASLSNHCIDLAAKNAEQAGEIITLQRQLAGARAAKRGSGKIQVIKCFRAWMMRNPHRFSTDELVSPLKTAKDIVDTHFQELH